MPATMNDCVFCRIVAGLSPAHIVYEDALTVALVDLRQANLGHVLVIPKSHLNDVRELDPDTGAALMTTLQRLTSAVAKAFPNDGISIWHSIGPSAFQEVPHLHLHIQPRLPNDQLLRVYPAEPENVDDAVRDDVARRLKVALAI